MYTVTLGGHQIWLQVVVWRMSKWTKLAQAQHDVTEHVFVLIVNNRRGDCLKPVIGSSRFVIYLGLKQRNNDLKLFLPIESGCHALISIVLAFIVSRALLRSRTTMLTKFVTFGMH
jgi:hypothetical protein